VTLRDRFYGPILRRATEGANVGEMEIAPLTLDVDALREFHEELSKSRPVRIHASSGAGGGWELGVASVDELLKLPPFDRRWIAFRSENYTNQSGLLVQFRTYSAGTVVYRPGSDEDAEVNRAFMALDHVANRRLRPRAFRGPARSILALSIIALYVWAWRLAVVAKTWPVLVLVGLALVPTARGLDLWVRERIRRIDEKFHVVRILEMSRSQLQQDRWNRKTTLKWAAPTSILTGLLGALITYLVKR
jgi:hypothetical protein